MKKTASRGSFTEGFNPVPSSEEESSDAEVDYEENIVKSKMGTKKKATTKTTVGCKPTKETGNNDLDDDEERVKRKKPNGTSMKSTAKNQKGNSKKSVNTTKRTGGNNSRKDKPIEKEKL